MSGFGLSHAALLRGLSTEQRAAHLYDLAQRIGWSSCYWPDWFPVWPEWAPAWMRRLSLTRFSMAFIPTSTVYLSRKVQRGTRENQLCALVHELIHARRAGRWLKWGWLALYLIWPPFRQAEEVEADAWGIAMHVRVRGLRGITADIDKLIDDNAEDWSDMQPPYYCWGGFDAARAKLKARVEGVLAETTEGHL